MKGKKERIKVNMSVYRYPCSYCSKICPCEDWVLLDRRIIRRGVEVPKVEGQDLGD